MCLRAVLLLKPPPGQLAALIPATLTARGKGHPKPGLAAQQGRLTRGDAYTLNVYAFLVQWC